MDPRGDPERGRQPHHHPQLTVSAGPGRLIVFEGLEGVGKTTQIRRLAEALERAGIPYRGFREPGGTALGNEIRRLVLDSTHEIGARAETLLFLASRAELVQRHIRPALAQGTTVLLDRYFLSTYAYQSAGRALPETEVQSANRFATGDLEPDLTLLLDLPVREGLARAERRSERDRMERSDDQFHRRVAAAFGAFATPEWQRNHPECGPIMKVDASGDEQAVAARVFEVLAGRWPETFAALPQSR